MVLIAVPFPTIGAISLALFGYYYYLVIAQVGEGVAVAAATVGFFVGIAFGTALHVKFAPKWNPGIDGAFVGAVIISVAAIALTGVVLLGTFIQENWDANE